MLLVRINNSTLIICIVFDMYVHVIICISLERNTSRLKSSWLRFLFMFIESTTCLYQQLACFGSDWPCYLSGTIYSTEPFPSLNPIPSMMVGLIENFAVASDWDQLALLGMTWLGFL